MDSNEVKKRLRVALEANKENPTSLAKKSGVNQKTLNNQINSDTSVSVGTILLVAKAFPSISMEWLIRGEGDMFLPSTQGAPVCNSGINGDRNINNTVNDSEMLNRLLDSLEAKDRQLAEKDNQIASLLSLIKQG